LECERESIATERILWSNEVEHPRNTWSLHKRLLQVFFDVDQIYEWGSSSVQFPNSPKIHWRTSRKENSLPFTGKDPTICVALSRTRNSLLRFFSFHVFWYNCWLLSWIIYKA